MTQAETELLPCPFCGETEHLSVRAEGSLTSDMPARPYRVCCHHIDHDDVEGPVGYGRAGAIAAWNRRTPPEVSAEGVSEEAVEARGEHVVTMTLREGRPPLYEWVKSLPYGVWPLFTREAALPHLRPSTPEVGSETVAEALQFYIRKRRMPTMAKMAEWLALLNPAVPK